ncbi:sugar ABC transporter substrate-binding protein [Devosia rhodophyticola]|uniref:Sugar ABC transporter substrate-binding protein n=1 Tax=Devosia rhodophyticola TaxID=3026423 RepID=A0ABY7YUP5_9HYPH|nr:sugar ABC transporter substrate-binding protein [Devosia rhodophyticola]
MTLKTAPWGDYWTKLPVLAASGQLADIVAMQSLRMPNFYSILEPLGDRAKADSFDVDAFDSSIIGGMSANGELYGLPYDVGPWMIFYNKDMFAADGVAEPTPGWTFDEFVTTAKALTKDGNYGAGITPQNFSIIASALGDHYVTDGTLDLTNAGAIAAAQSMVDLVATDKVAPVVASGSDPGAFISGRFDAGNVGMYIDGPWAMINKIDTVDFQIGLAPLPRGEGDLEAATAGSGFGISASSTHKDAAWQAIQVITSPEALVYLASQGRALPARTAQQVTWYDVAAKDVAGAREALEYSLAHSATYEITDNWNAVENLFNQYFPQAFAGSATAEATMNAVQSLAVNQ